MSRPPSKGWKAPKTRKARRAYAKRCGLRKCFLKPEDLKFPICDTRCNVSCKGLAAAYNRARQFKYHDVARRAWKLAHKEGCSWASKRMRRKGRRAR